MSSFGGSYGISGDSSSIDGSGSSVYSSGEAGAVQLSNGVLGLTNHPLFKADVATGTVTVSSLKVVNSFNPGASFAFSSIQGDPDINLITGGNTINMISSNVGIGTTKPLELLHVQGNVYTTGNIVCLNNSIIGGGYTGASLRLGQGYLGASVGNRYSPVAHVGVLTARTIKDDTINPLSISSSSSLVMASDRIHLLTNYGVGIGTATPMKELHVVGNTLVTNSMTASYVGVGVNGPFTEQLHVQGSVTATSHMSIGGIFRGAGMRVGDVALSFGVDKNASVQGDLYVVGDSVMNNVHVRGSLTSSDITSETNVVNFHKKLVANEDVEMNSNAVVLGDLNVSGNVFSTGYITATEGLDFGDNLRILGSISSDKISSYSGGSSIIEVASNVGFGTSTVDSGYLVQVGGSAKASANVDATNIFADDVRSTKSMRSDGSFVANNMRLGGIFNISSQKIDTNYITSNLKVSGLLDVGGDILGTNVSINVNNTSTRQILVRNSDTSTGEASIGVVSGPTSNIFGMGQKNTGECYLVNYADADMNIIQRERGNIRFLIGNNQEDFFNIGKFGKIGIGIADPTYKLTMDGSFRLSGLFGDPYSNPTNPKFYFTDTITTPGTTPFNASDGRVNVKHTANVYMSFMDSATVYGRITQVGGSTNYATPSDYRIKSNVEPLSNALVKVESLEPVQFTFNSHPDKKVAGFIAHQVNEHIPQAVTGNKDEINEDGEIVIQTIDKSHMIPYLVAAVKELSSRVSSLENILSKE